MKKTASAICVLMVVAAGVGFYKLRLVTHVKSQQPCANNLRVIDGAKDQWSVEARATAGTAVAVENILPYMKSNMMPVCNAGGTYVIGNVGEEPRCTIHGTHSKFNPDRY